MDIFWFFFQFVAIKAKFLKFFYYLPIEKFMIIFSAPPPKLYLKQFDLFLRILREGNFYFIHLVIGNV